MPDIRLNVLAIPFLLFLIFALFLSTKPIEVLGIIFGLALFYHCGRIIFTGIYTTWIGQYLGHNVDVGTLGKWAVVTGATDGIGLAYCRELACLGRNIVLISRTEAKLKACAEEIEAQFGVQVKYIPVDFGLAPETYEFRVKEELKHLEIGLLINNVGKAYDYPQLFHEATSSLEFPTTMININIHAVTVMTAIVLPQMLQRNKGAVINVGSVTSYWGFPYFSLYSASKAYMQRLTQDLGIEYKDMGIIFQYQCPGYITSKLSKISKSSFLIPTPKQYAQTAVQTLGLQTHSCIWPWHRMLIPLYDIGKVIVPEAIDKASSTISRSFWLKASLKRSKKQVESEM